MTVTGISNNNVSQVNTQNYQNRFQQVKSEFQQLGADLQAGSLAQAQQDFTAHWMMSHPYALGQGQQFALGYHIPPPSPLLQTSHPLDLSNTVGVGFSMPTAQLANMNLNIANTIAPQSNTHEFFFF